MSRLPMNNLQLASLMGQHVPVWLAKQAQHYENLCQELRFVLGDTMKANLIIEDIRRTVESSIYSNMAYATLLLDEAIGKARRGEDIPVLDNQSLVDKWSQADLADKREGAWDEG